MNIVRKNLHADDMRDDGMSLVEVIVAISIISLVALATASLTLNGTSFASSQERTQVAVTIANGAMEDASAMSISDIYEGRTKAAVTAAFAANATIPGIAVVAGVAPTYPAWDTTAPVPAIVALPITAAPLTQNGTTYSTTTLVGVCYQRRTGGDCTTLSAYATPPASAPAGYMALVRVVVAVRWTGGQACAPAGCFYSASTLVDPGVDLEWVTHD